MCNINIQIKRIYESSDEHDGLRVLVDRLWPRGISKEKANLDLWCKDIAPSSDLRKWFGHKSERFEEFANRYIEELDENQDCVNQIVDICRKIKSNVFIWRERSAYKSCNCVKRLHSKCFAKLRL